ncbi:MAG TPA: hypothetical protein VGF12_26200, partial [Roseateles sp.]
HPGSAELGRWNPREVAPEAARTDEVSNAPPSTATLELPEGFKPIEREQLATPVPRQVPMPAVELPPAVGRLEARPEAAVHVLRPTPSLRAESRPAELPTVPAELPSAVSRLEPTPVPARATALPRPAELRAVPAPTALPSTNAELPPPVRRLDAQGEARVPTDLPRAAALRAAPAAPSQPLPSGAPLPAAVQRLEATAAESTGVTPLNRPSDLRMLAGTAMPSLPGDRDLPTPVRRLEAPDGPSAVTPLRAAPAPRVLPATPAGSALPALSGDLPGQVSAPAGPSGPARGDPNADPFAAPKASAGSPDAGSRLGPDLALAPSAAASAPRAPLNLSLPRGGDIAARRGPGLVDLLPQPPERKSRLEQSIEKAANQDCRKAYANAGLLAALPLAVDAARGKGCKW